MKIFLMPQMNHYFILGWPACELFSYHYIWNKPSATLKVLFSTKILIPLITCAKPSKLAVWSQCIEENLTCFICTQLVSHCHKMALKPKTIYFILEDSHHLILFACGILCLHYHGYIIVLLFRPRVWAHRTQLVRKF